MTFEVEIAGRVCRIELATDGEQETITVDGRPLAVNVASGGRAWSLLIGHRSHEVTIDETAGGELLIGIDGQQLRALVTAGVRAGRAAGRAGAGGAKANGPYRVLAPMPGRIVKVLARKGDVVVPQQALIVIEAMKMENELRAAAAGTVTDVRVAEGALVESGAVLALVE